MTGLGDWHELAPGAFTLVAEPEAVNIGLIVGSERALLVDSGASPEQGRRLRKAVRRQTDRALTGVVLTHWHYDHAFGLAAFDDLETLAHESVRKQLTSPAATRDAEPLGLAAADLALPNHELVVMAALDLGGGRRVEIAHLGLGHTDGDLVVVVPDADLLFVGDLLESSGPPSFGDDCYPDEWSSTLDGVIGLMTSTTRAVPGHGEPVDRLFAFGQRGEVAGVAGEIRRLFEAGVTQAEASSRGSWPYPATQLSQAIARGYALLTEQGVRPARPDLPLA